MTKVAYINPIIRGFYPDPSICYAEGKYYLVCSSFQFFPGLPLFSSEDMIHWESIGHCMTNPEDLDLTSMGASGGLYAPTIRYWKGTFYVVCTNVGGYGNFMVKATNPAGPWSAPILIDRPGIDPSLLFEGEKAYFISNGQDDWGEEGISVCEMDLENGKILTKSKCISKGTGGRYLEGPHLYRIGEYYYLLAAEGGTEYGHMECLHRSKNLYGPYESCPHNPVLTNRNLGGYFIQGSGHADIVEDTQGQWWMVHLAFRQMDRWRPYHQMGRETFLVPLYWDQDGWFHVGTDGTCRAAYEVDIDSCKAMLEAEYPTKTWKPLEKKAIYIRKPDFSNYRFLQEGAIALKGTTDGITSLGNVTFLGMRQEEFNTSFQVKVCLDTMLSGQRCGITAYMSEKDHFDVTVCKTYGEENNYQVSCKFYAGSMEVPQREQNWTVAPEDTQTITLTIETSPQEYHAYGEGAGTGKVELGSIDAKYLSSEVTEGFTGVLLGVYCEANEAGESNFVKMTYC